MVAQFVLDSSVAMAWCFEDGAAGYSDKVLGSLDTHEAVTPAVWPLELGNALLVAERKRRVSKADSARFLNLVSGLPIRVEQESPERMFKEIVEAAREHHLSTYDASYLDLAMRLEIPLATQDSALRKAARKCGVPVFAAQGS